MTRHEEIAKKLEQLEKEGAGTLIFETGKQYLNSFGQSRRHTLTKFKMGLFILGIPVQFGLSNYALCRAFPEIREKNRGRKAVVTYKRDAPSVTGFSVWWKEKKGVPKKEYVFRAKDPLPA